MIIFIVLMERLEEIGGLICEHNQLETSDELMVLCATIVILVN